MLRAESPITLDIEHRPILYASPLSLPRLDKPGIHIPWPNEWHPSIAIGVRILGIIEQRGNIKLSVFRDAS